MSDQSAWRKWYEKNRERAKALKRDQMRRARAEKPDVYNAHSRRAKVKEKLRLFEMYGRSCARCGFDDMRALSLDHIHNDGNEQRRQLGERGVYRDAKKAFQPDKYQVLCMNCQFIKRVEHSGHVDLNREWQQQHSPNCSSISMDEMATPVRAGNRGATDGTAAQGCVLGRAAAPAGLGCLPRAAGVGAQP